MHYLPHHDDVLPRNVTAHSSHGKDLRAYIESWRDLIAERIIGGASHKSLINSTKVQSQQHTPTLRYHSIANHDLPLHHDEALSFIINPSPWSYDDDNYRRWPTSTTASSVRAVDAKAFFHNIIIILSSFSTNSGIQCHVTQSFTPRR